MGADIGYLFHTSFDQAEYMIKPENIGTFENGKRVRNQQSGSIPDTKTFLYFITVGVDYEFVLDEFSVNSLAPFVNISYGLNSLFADRKWIINSISCGINYRFNQFIEISTPLKPEEDN